MAKVAFDALLASPCYADLTAANASRDRAAFVKCSDEIDVMSQSADGRMTAQIACTKAVTFYSNKADTARNENDSCYYSLYAGSSMERLGYIMKSSLNQTGSKKAYALGDKILSMVISECPHEPNIVNAAKGVLRASRAMR